MLVLGTYRGITSFQTFQPPYEVGAIIVSSTRKDTRGPTSGLVRQESACKPGSCSTLALSLHCRLRSHPGPQPRSPIIPMCHVWSPHPFCLNLETEYTQGLVGGDGDKSRSPRTPGTCCLIFQEAPTLGNRVCLMGHGPEWKSLGKDSSHCRCTNRLPPALVVTPVSPHPLSSHPLRRQEKQATLSPEPTVHSLCNRTTILMRTDKKKKSDRKVCGCIPGVFLSVYFWVNSKFFLNNI